MTIEYVDEENLLRMVDTTGHLLNTFLGGGNIFLQFHRIFQSTGAGVWLELCPYLPGRIPPKPGRWSRFPGSWFSYRQDWTTEAYLGGSSCFWPGMYLDEPDRLPVELLRYFPFPLYRAQYDVPSAWLDYCSPLVL